MPPNVLKEDFEGKFDPFIDVGEDFPAFSKNRPVVCVQEPGELVFVPSGWWHAVYNAESGISLTENFINDTNYKQVQNYFVSKSADIALLKLQSIVKRNKYGCSN